MSTRPSIVFVLPVLGSAGAERIVFELATRLPAEGFRTSVICLEDERLPLGTELDRAGIPVIGLRMSRRRSVGCARRLLKELPTSRPLILHSHLFHANIVARLAYKAMALKAREGVAVIGTIHVAERRFRPWQFLLDRVTADFAKLEICVSHSVKRFHQERTGLPEHFFRVVENGVDCGRFAPAAAKFDTQMTAQTVLSVGRLDPQKDFPTLLRAWKIIEGEQPAAKLLIAGEGPERKNIQALVHSLNLRNVELLGFVADVAALMQRAVLYVQPSAWEGFCLTVAEAMACGLPVIVTDADSLPELVAHGRTGWVVPKSKPEPLAKAIGQLLSDRARAVELGTAARQEAFKRFSLERMVADYARLYQEILSSRTSEI